MKNYSAQSFWINKKRGSIKNELINQPLENDELLIKAHYSGISYGTEKIVFDSQVPANQYKLMRAPHQVGEFNKEVKYGYLSVGEVIIGPKNLLNKMVYTMFPHQSMYVLKTSFATLIPDHIPHKRALLTANMETAINAVWDSNPSIGDKTYVIGCGVVGILMAYVLSKTFGVKVTLIDKDNSKSKLCELFNINFENNIDCIEDPDIIYECSGNISVLNELANICTLETKICVLSWYGKQQAKIKMGENFFSRRLKIIFSQVGNITAIKSKKWNNLTRRALALELLDNKKLDILIDKKEIKLKDLPSFFKKGNINGLCKVVRY